MKRGSIDDRDTSRLVFASRLTCAIEPTTTVMCPIAPACSPETILTGSPDLKGIAARKADGGASLKVKKQKMSSRDGSTDSRLSDGTSILKAGVSSILLRGRFPIPLRSGLRRREIFHELLASTNPTMRAMECRYPLHTPSLRRTHAPVANRRLGSSKTSASSFGTAVRPV